MVNSMPHLGAFSTGKEPVRVQPAAYGMNQRRAFPPRTMLVLNQEVGSEREPSRALVFPSEPWRHTWACDYSVAQPERDAHGISSRF